MPSVLACPLYLRCMMEPPVSQSELFHYTGVWQRTTALPMRIWVPDDGAHGGNIRVQRTHVAVSLPNEVALVSISEEPRLLTVCSPSRTSPQSGRSC